MERTQEIKIIVCEMEHNLRNAQVLMYSLLYYDKKIGNALIIRYNDEKETHISSLFVEKPYRHKGYASKIVQQIRTDSPLHYKITAYSGVDLKDFWFKNGLTRKGKMRSEGLYSYEQTT